MKTEVGTILIAKYDINNLVKGKEYTILLIDGKYAYLSTIANKMDCYVIDALQYYFDIKEGLSKVEANDIKVGTVLIAKVSTISLTKGQKYTVSLTHETYCNIIIETNHEISYSYSDINCYFDIKEETSNIETPKVKKYLVTSISDSNTIQYEYEYDNYDTALDKVKILCKEKEVTTYIYKAITKIEFNDIKITKL